MTRGWAEEQREGGDKERLATWKNGTTVVAKSVRELS